MKNVFWIALAIVIATFIVGCSAPRPTPQPTLTPKVDIFANKKTPTPVVNEWFKPTRTPTRNPCSDIRIWIIDPQFAEKILGCPTPQVIPIPSGNLTRGVPDYSKLPANPVDVDFPAPPWIILVPGRENDPAIAEALINPIGFKEIFKYKAYGKEYGLGWLKPGDFQGILVRVCFTICNQPPPTPEGQ